MGMALGVLEKTKKITRIGNYAIQKCLAAIGVHITNSGLNQFKDRDVIEKPRMDLVCALRVIQGKRWDDYGPELDRQFLPKITPKQLEDMRALLSEEQMKADKKRKASKTDI